MVEPAYKRLTGSHSRTAFGIVSVSRSSLWLGEDHVLGIDLTGYSETYKRFYFRDIQAILIRRTGLRMVWGFVYGGLTALFALIAIAPRELVVGIIFGAFAALSLWGFIHNLLAGPTCACRLRTAVQTEDLPSLVRVRQARKVLDRLRPLISEAQGQLVPEEIPSRFRAWMESNPGVSAPVTTPRYIVDDPNAPPRMVL